MEEAQIKQIIKRQPLHGSALLDPRCKILLLVCIGFVSYFLAGEVVSLALMLVYGLFIALGNGEKWAAKMIVTYIVVAYLNALLRYVQVPVLSGKRVRIGKLLEQEYLCIVQRRETTDRNRFCLCAGTKSVYF